MWSESNITHTCHRSNSKQTLDKYSSYGVWYWCTAQQRVVNVAQSVPYPNLISNNSDAGGVYLGEKLSSFSDISQNSILEKQTLHKIQYRKNGLFTKFITRKMDSSQNSLPENRTFCKIHYQKNGLFTKFNIRKTDSSQNSICRHESFYHFLGIPLYF